MGRAIETDRLVPTLHSEQRSSVKIKKNKKDSETKTDPSERCFMTATLLLCALLVNISDEKHGCSSSTGEKDRRSQVHPSLCSNKKSFE